MVTGDRLSVAHYKDAKMSLYHSGYYEARQQVKQMSLEELFDYIDALQGRENLDSCDIEDVRFEALRQCQEEFTDKSSRDWETVNFWTSVIKASQR